MESTEKPDLEEILRRVVVQAAPGRNWKNVVAGVGVLLSVIASLGGWYDNANRIEDWKPVVDARLDVQTRQADEVSDLVKELSSRMNNVEVTSRVLEKSFDAMIRQMQELREDVRRIDGKHEAGSERK